MLDIALRGGTIVDGTGSCGWQGDIGIRDGRITELGENVQTARREVDIGDLVVAPGFIDIHTHYDAQIHWDPTLNPSSLHGVTTVIAGNCGYTLAPVIDRDVSYITRMLSRVEGMPLESLEEGLSVNWQSFGDFLDQLDGRTALNAGFLVGHSTIRRMVMGEAATETTATHHQIDKMRELLAESIAAGGLGLSSSWSAAAFDGDNCPVPSRLATEAELVALSNLTGEFQGTVLEFVPGAGAFGASEANAMIAMSLAANRPLNWNAIFIHNPLDIASAEMRLAASTAARIRGAAVVGLINPDPIQTRTSVAVPVGSFVKLPGWEKFTGRSKDEQLRILQDPQERELLREAAAAAQDQRLRDFANFTVSDALAPKNERYEGWTLGDGAKERHVDPFDAFALLSIESGLRAWFLLPPSGDDEATWQHRISVVRDPRALIGGSDAGAHLGQLCGARYTTSLLASAVRTHGLLRIEEAVHALSDAPARLYGLVDRGRIQTGYWADLVVLDPNEVHPGTLCSLVDLPGGASRLHSEPKGIARVFVNGTEIVSDGFYTGDLPGRVLRSTTGDLRTVDLQSYWTAQALTLKRPVFAD